MQCVTDKPGHPDNFFNDTILTSLSFVYNFVIFETKNQLLVSNIAYSEPIDMPCHPDNIFNDTMLNSQTFEYYFMIFETENLFLVHLILLNHSICSVLPTSPAIKTTCQSVHQAQQDCLQVISSNLYFEYDERPYLQDGLQEVSSSLHCKHDKYALLVIS